MGKMPQEAQVAGKPTRTLIPQGLLRVAMQVLRAAHHVRSFDVQVAVVSLQRQLSSDGTRHDPSLITASAVRATLAAQPVTAQAAAFLAGLPHSQNFPRCCNPLGKHVAVLDTGEAAP